MEKPLTDNGDRLTRGAESPFERLVESADAPLLALALFSALLYLLELRGWVPSAGPALVASILIDLLFFLDLLVKVAVKRGRYLRSAWLMTDILSCLPGIMLAVNVPWMQALQFARLFRVLRVLRGLRILRSLQFMPSLAHTAAEEDGDGRRLRVAMNAGVTVYAAAFIGILAWLHGELALDPEALADAEFFLVLGALLATALFLFIIHSQLRETLWNQLRALLNIALPQQVAEHFLRHPEAYQERGRAEATVLFIDFVGFSATAERLRDGVQTLAEHLELAMDVVVERLVANDLIIDKFIGDAVMAFRGGPLVSGDAPGHARRVVIAAMEAASALSDLADPYFSRVKIGGASGECLIGAFGTSSRLSYTALGDSVNLAARLEPASAQCGALSLFCDETRRLCGDDPRIAWRRWGSVRVKGKAEPQVVWEAFDASRAPDLSFVELYERARDAFERGETAAARALFLEADQARPGGDQPSRMHSTWCDEMLEMGSTSFDRALTVTK
jgi:adenylate cyclase